MFMKYPVIFQFIIYLSSGIDAQICGRLVTVTWKDMEIRPSYAKVTYYDQCPELCIKTKWIHTQVRRPIINSGLKAITHCCKGYKQDKELSWGAHIECKPVCEPACKNGTCSAPGVCTCNPGYSLDPNDGHNATCLPVCNSGCPHGTCVAPNECTCNIGYILVNDTCQPGCTEPCHNGTCVAPDTCECNPGYRKSENNRCEPYCSNGCDNGVCTAPETCQCNPGWHLTENKVLSTKTCQLMCSTPCGNGDCIAPDTCKCWPSYKLSANGICEPECPSGWKSENLTCVAQCRIPCGNGTCMSPNVCVCFTGYRIDINKLRMGLSDGPLCISSCSDCDENNEICVAPDVCINKESTTLPRLCDDSKNCSAVTDGEISVTALAETTDTYETDDFDAMNTISSYPDDGKHARKSMSNVWYFSTNSPINP